MARILYDYRDRGNFKRESFPLITEEEILSIISEKAVFFDNLYFQLFRRNSKHAICWLDTSPSTLSYMNYGLIQHWVCVSNLQVEDVFNLVNSNFGVPLEYFKIWVPLFWGQISVCVLSPCYFQRHHSGFILGTTKVDPSQSLILV